MEGDSSGSNGTRFHLPPVSVRNGQGGFHIENSTGFKGDGSLLPVCRRHPSPGTSSQTLLRRKESDEVFTSSDPSFHLFQSLARSFSTLKPAVWQ